MILSILDEYLPMELANLIYKKFHRSCLRDIGIILRHKIVFVLVGERISFLICEGQKYTNYYDPLLSFVVS